MPENTKDKITFVPIEKLHLDNERNPRLPKKVEGANLNEILKYMVEEANLLELMASIGEKGFFPGEPLLVVPSKKESGYTVIEGNRRLSAVMLLNDPTLVKIKPKSITQIADHAKYKPKTLPVIKYDSRDEIINYLGYRHITGVKEWDSLAKSKYLRQLYDLSLEEDIDEKCRELAKIIGSRKDYVKKLLCSLNIYEAIQEKSFYGLKDPEDISFSLITTALGYSKIQEFLGLESMEDLSLKGLNEEHLGELTLWMFLKKENQTRLGESRNLDKLAHIVSTEGALMEFRKGVPLDDAFLFTKGPKDSVLNAIGEALRHLNLAYTYAKNLELNPKEQEPIENIIKTAQAIKKQTTPTSND